MKAFLVNLIVGIFFIVLGAFVQVNYQSILPINGKIYQLISSPSSSFLLFACATFVFLPTLITSFDKVALYYSSIILRSSYGLLARDRVIYPSLIIITSIIFSLSLGYFAHAMATSSYVFAREYKWSEELQRQRFIKKANSLLLDKKLDQAISTYQIILDEGLSADFTKDRVLEEHIKELKVASQIWNDSMLAFDKKIESGELFKAAYLLDHARSVWGLGEDKEEKEMMLLEKLNEKSEIIDQTYNNCKTANVLSFKNIAENSDLFTEHSEASLKNYVEEMNKNISAPKPLFESICSRITIFKSSDEYSQGLVNGKVFTGGRSDVFW